MLETLIRKSTDYFISHDIIDADDRDVYEYGFHALYSNVVIFSVIGLIAFFAKQLPVTIAYHVAFIVMRNNAGGYHAKTQIRCFFMSTIIWIISLCVISAISSLAVIIAAALVSTVLIWFKAPIEHENNPMSEKKYQRMKIRSRIFSTVLLLGTILVCLFGTDYLWVATAVAIGMFSHAILFGVALYSSTITRRA